MTKKKRILLVVLLGVAVLFIGGGVFVFNRYYGQKTAQDIPPVQNASALDHAAEGQPFPVQNTQPENAGFTDALMVNGELWEGPFVRQAPIFFGEGSDYTDMEGIVTFRGDNYRDTASYGSPVVTEKKLELLWTVETGTMPKSSTTKDKGASEWSGSGWTGQPIIVRWDAQTRQVMNLYDGKKSKDGLTEIIYATMDGKVYFLDLEDGSATRDALDVGLPFKGAGAIRPDGIPMLFVGPGDSMEEMKGEAGLPDVSIYSLTDCSLLYRFGGKDPFSPRLFHGYDSSPLVDVETDTLIYPGENGILYTMQLNTQYNPEDGALSIRPSDEVKWTYSTDKTSEEAFWWGMEDSAVVADHFLYIADNAGNMVCMDINTMEVVWLQDILDDTNASPVYEVDAAGNRFIYIAPSLHWQKDAETNTGQVSMYKLNAVTGDIIWQKPYEVHTVNGLSGGIQATPVLGQGPISDLVIVPVARTPYKNTGILVALDKETGEERWRFDMDEFSLSSSVIPWSSPVAVYAEDGTPYIIQCGRGKVYLMDGETGTLLDTLDTGKANIEASPAVFGNTIVVGTRGERILGMTIK